MIQITNYLLLPHSFIHSCSSSIHLFRIIPNQVPVCSCSTPIPSDLNITFSPTSLLLTSSISLPAFFFQNLLRDHIYFQPSLSRPNGSSSVVMVTVSDGMFVSEPAYSVIDVIFRNNRPEITINGAVRERERERNRETERAIIIACIYRIRLLLFIIIINY